MRPVFLAAFLLFSYVLCAQSTCEIWQWMGADSTNKILACSRQLDTHGNAVHEKLNGYLYEPDIYGYGGVNGENIYIYSDTFLMTYYFVGANGDSVRTEFQYDDKGRRTREISSLRRFVMTDTVQSGIFTITTVATDTTANEWEEQSVLNYSYDAAGRKIKVEIIRPDISTKDYFIWTYDSQGRVGRLDYILRGKNHFTAKYVYAPRQVFISPTYYNDRGKIIKKPGKNSPTYMQKRALVDIKDEQGRVIEKRTEGSKGKLLEREVITYNEDGEIAREVWYDGAGNVEMVHEYIYK